MRSRILVQLSLVAITTIAALPTHAAAQEALWRPSLPAPPFGDSSLSLFPSGDGFAYLTNDPARLYKTTDFGGTWSILDAPQTGASAVVEFGKPRVGIVAGNGRIMKTTDGGKSWRAVRGPDLGGPDEGTANQNFPIYTAAALVGRQNVVLGGRISKTRTGCSKVPTKTWFFVSGDGGRTWSQSHVPFHGGVEHIDFLDRRHGIAVAYEYTVTESDGCGHSGHSIRNAILVTHDGGRHFEEVLSCRHYPEEEVGCWAAAMVTPRRLIVGRDDGSTLISTDGGRTFRDGPKLLNAADTALGTTTSFGVWSIEFADRKTGYALTNGGGIWRTTDGGDSWTEETSPYFLAGLSLGDLAVADSDHAIAGGPHFISTRTDF